ncbi:MAG: ATP-binding protein [Ruminococcus sp.]|nr:ATP-binding protein [Ruminococcus sp.]
MIKKLFRQMLLTQILSSMTVMLCMLIDSIMIGRFLGVDSMAAYGLAAPILLVFAAMGNMISAGIQVVCGKTMGSGDRKGTNACFSVSVTMAAAISIIGVILVIVFTPQICTMLGASKPELNREVFNLTEDYLRGFIIGAPAFIFAQIMVPYMQMSGNRTRLVVAVGLMTVSDIIFDALNVLVIHGGTFGMGLASSLSYYIAFFIGIAYFFKKDCIFHFRPKRIKMKVCAALVKAGIPTLVNQISLVLLTLVLNKVLLDVGQKLAVAAYSVISTAGNICYSFSSGIASVALMLSSIFYADEDRNSLRDIVKTMAFYAVVICTAVTAAVFIGANVLVSIFLDNPDAEDLAINGMRLFVLSLVPCAINTCFKNYYQGIDRVRLSIFISVLQNFVFTAICAFVLSRFFGTTGVWVSFVCGEVLTMGAMSVYVFVKNRSFEISSKNYSLIGDDFGVSDDDCFEQSITTRDEIVRVSAAASEFCQSHGLDRKLSNVISLCIEEMSRNTIDYGFSMDDKEHSIDIRLLIKENDPVLRIRDNCINFDPVRYMETHKDDENDSTDDSSMHMGIRMVMNMAQKVKYVNSLGFNNLTMSMWKDPKDGESGEGTGTGRHEWRRRFKRRGKSAEQKRA